MGVERMADLVRVQAMACGELGSALYAALLDRVADDILAGGPAAQVLDGHENDPGPSALALRLAAAVHRLVLTGRAPGLAAHYPSAGGDGDADAAWPAFRAVLAGQQAAVVAELDTPPQTNEVGRSAALLGALLELAGDDPLPVRLWEIGASAGLNLRADRFRYRGADGTVWGPMSPVELEPAWTGRPPGWAGPLHVVERVGGDPAPIDPTSEAGALRLASYVWPDQITRLRRLRGAFLVAGAYPARLARADAAGLLAELEPAGGTLTVLWHSVMWQYLSAGEQQAALARLAEIGAVATSRGPFAHIAFEPRRLAPDGPDRFLVVARTWPGGRERVLGEAPPHGIPIRWGTPEA